MDIQFLLQKFLDHATYIKCFSKATIRRYKYSVSFFCEYTGLRKIDEVSPDKITDFIFYGRTERDWNSNTYLTYYKSLLVFFRWCVTNGYLVRHPMDEMQWPKVEKRLPPKLTKQQSQWLLEVALNFPYITRFERHRNHAVVATFMYAGLRKSELLHLNYSDVDLENLVLFIRQGKGAKDRTIPVSFTLAQILKQYLEERHRLKKTCPEFFTSTENNQGFNDTALKRLIVKLRKTSGIEFSIHKLRHTFATLMIEGGCDIYALSRMMGHSNITTTTIYLAASVEHLRSQINKHPLNNTCLFNQP